MRPLSPSNDRAYVLPARVGPPPQSNSAQVAEAVGPVEMVDIKTSPASLATPSLDIAPKAELAPKAEPANKGPAYSSPQGCSGRILMEEPEPPTAAQEPEGLNLIARTTLGWLREEFTTERLGHAAFLANAKPGHHEGEAFDPKENETRTVQWQLGQALKLVEGGLGTLARQAIEGKLDRHAGLNLMDVESERQRQLASLYTPDPEQVGKDGSFDVLVPPGPKMAQIMATLDNPLNPSNPPNISRSEIEALLGQGSTKEQGQPFAIRPGQSFPTEPRSAPALIARLDNQPELSAEQVRALLKRMEGA